MTGANGRNSVRLTAFTTQDRCSIICYRCKSSVQAETENTLDIQGVCVRQGMIKFIPSDLYFKLPVWGGINTHKNNFWVAGRLEQMYCFVMSIRFSKNVFYLARNVHVAKQVFKHLSCSIQVSPLQEKRQFLSFTVPKTSTVLGTVFLGFYLNTLRKCATTKVQKNLRPIVDDFLLTPCLPCCW